LRYWNAGRTCTKLFHAPIVTRFQEKENRFRRLKYESGHSCDFRTKVFLELWLSGSTNTGHIIMEIEGALPSLINQR
jgi:transposase